MTNIYRPESDIQNGEDLYVYAYIHTTRNTNACIYPGILW